MHFVFVTCIVCVCHLTRYRLSSGNNETSSSEDEYYDGKEAKVYGRNKAKVTEKAAAPKKDTAEGLR